MNKRVLIGAYILLAVVLAACGFDVSELELIEGSGDVITEEQDASNFDSVVLSGIGTARITQGDDESLTITADDNLMQYFETEVRDGTLEIGLTEEGRNKLLRPSQPVVFRVGAIDLVSLTGSGIGDIEIDELEAGDLDLRVSGAGDIEIDDLQAGGLDLTLSGAGDIHIDELEADDVEVTVSGIGGVEVDGTVQSQDITMSGAGRYDASDLESQSAKVVSSGVGKVTVWPLETLDVTLSGAGGVEYYGEPEVTEDVSGVGRLISLGAK
jgi:hypothetical protein